MEEEQRNSRRVGEGKREEVSEEEVQRGGGIKSRR